MTSSQSTLGGAGIADELAKGQREISIAEFFEKNKHMLGFDSEARAIVTAVKEAVDNALDATEEAEILPSVYVEVSETNDYYTVVIEDNGPGITKAQIPKIFGKLLYGSKFHKRVQSRGQQGIGISAAVLHSQLTSGKPARITSKTEGSEKATYFELIIDTDKNEPEIQTEADVEWDKDHGTRIELEMAANMRGRTQLHDYIRHTAVVNPHSRIELREPEAHFVFERVSEDLPIATKEIRPHPHGVELGTVIKMLNSTKSHSLSGFLQEEFTRVGKKTANGILNEFRDRHFGREYGFYVPDDTEELEAALESSINKKGQEATEGFINLFIEELESNGRSGYSDVREAITVAADDSVEAFGKPFGKVTRENALEAAWGVLSNDVHGSIYEVIKKSAGPRKSTETVEAIVDSLTTDLTKHNGKYRVTHSQVVTFISDAADAAQKQTGSTVGDTSRTNMVKALWETTQTVPDKVPLVREVAEDRDMAHELVQAMTAADIMSPPTDCLSPISAELIETGMKKVFEGAEFYASSTRSAGVHSGEPFVAEAGLAYGGKIQSEGSIELLRFANKVPLVYQPGACSLTKVVKGINWRNYFPSGSRMSQSGGSGLPDGPMVLSVHVASTNVPFTSESKDAVADVEEIEDEIRLAVREVGRELKSFLKKKRDREKRQKKQNHLIDILPEIAQKSAELIGEDEVDVNPSLAQIMNNVHITRTYADATSEVTVENFTRRKYNLTLTETISHEPTDIPSDATVEKTNDGWEVIHELSVESGKTQTYAYDLSKNGSWNVEVKGIDQTLLTITDESMEEN